MAEQALFQPFNRNQQRENLESTKETGLLISLIPSLQEDFYVDSLTTGASSDLKTATAIAKNMICSYGMDENIGLAVVQENEIENSFMSQKVREAVNKVLSDELSKAKKILSDNRAALDKIVEVLLKENHLSSNMIDEIFSQNAKRTEG